MTGFAKFSGIGPLPARSFQVRFFTAVLAFLPGLASAAQTTVTAPTPNSTQTLQANASLDFLLNISKFVYFGLGTFTFPNTSSAVNSLAFKGGMTIPGPSSTVAVNGNDKGVAWNGSAPVPSVSSPSFINLGTKVLSNAGQVRINIAVVNPMTRSSGGAPLPFSRLTIASNSFFMPPPVPPNPGTTAGAVGTAANVTPSGSSNLVTDRAAFWSFGFNFQGITDPGSTVLPGTYSGRLRFTASVP